LQNLSRHFWNFEFPTNRATVLPIRQHFWVRGKVLVRAKIQKLLVSGIFAFSSSRAQHFYRMAALSCACQQNRRQTPEKHRFHWFYIKYVLRIHHFGAGASQA